MARAFTALVAAAFLCGGAGCLSKNVPEPTRYFEPGPAATDPTAVKVTLLPPRGTAKAARPALRLRRVTAAAHLRDRFATRVSDVEIGFDDLVRWTEPPVVYLERAMGWTLFEAGPFLRTEGAAAPRLDVELRSFEEDRAKDGPAAVVEVWASLVDAKDGSLLERCFTARRALEGKGPEAMARAAGQALADATREAAKEIAATLAKVPAGK